MLTFVGIRWYYKNPPQKSSGVKKMKKAVDKRSPRWYDVKVACDNGTKRTLIIKQ